MNGHYYLVIGMAKESSIVYFFGGILEFTFVTIINLCFFREF